MSYVEAAPQSKDKLARVRTVMRELRDLSFENERMEEAIKENNKKIYDLERVQLVELFMMAGIDHLGLPAEGNMPAYDAVLKPYYKAVIASSWEQDKKDEAFAALEKIKAGDLIKTIITVKLPLKSQKLTQRVLKALKLLKVPFSLERNVPWTTLTSFVKERMEKQKPLPPLSVIGADVGQIVELKRRKEV